MTRGRRRALAALLVALAALAAPAAAYVLPVPGILKRMGERRASLSLAALEVTGSFVARGEAAEAIGRGAGLAAVAGQVSAPAIFRMKVPGRCRLELAPAELPEVSRPFVSLRDGRLSGAGGLDKLPSAVAFLRTACALLGAYPGGDVASTYAASLGRHGVALTEVTLGRFDGHLAFVVGGRQKDAAKPLLFVDKDAFQPMRLVASEAGVMLDVRLLGWGSPTGGDWFPRAAEVWAGEVMRLRFTAERTVPNPKLAEALFP
jgi:hypothetical protein